MCFLAWGLSAEGPRKEAENDWPRRVDLGDGYSLVVHQPQIERWKGFRTLDVRVAATLEMPAGTAGRREAFGTVRLRLPTEVDVARAGAGTTAPASARGAAPSASTSVTSARKRTTEAQKRGSQRKAETLHQISLLLGCPEAER